MRYEEVSEFIQNENKKGNYSFILTFEDGHKESKRLFYNCSGICQFKSRSRKFGYLYSLPNEIADINVALKKLPIDILRNSLKKAIKYLSVSHLWEDRYNALIYLNKQSDETLQNYIDNGLGNLFEDNEVCRLSEDEFIGLYKKGIKTIRYDNWDKDFFKKCVKEAIQEKKDYSYTWRNGYDNRISVGLCKDGKMRAWYSEEFTGCLNGHYYLALDETHVMHCEDD